MKENMRNTIFNLLVLLPTIIIIAFSGFVVGLKTGYEMPRQLVEPRPSYLEICTNTCKEVGEDKCFGRCLEKIACPVARFL